MYAIALSGTLISILGSSQGLGREDSGQTRFPNSWSGVLRLNTSCFRQIPAVFVFECLTAFTVQGGGWGVGVGVEGGLTGQQFQPYKVKISHILHIMVSLGHGLDIIDMQICLISK